MKKTYLLGLSVALAMTACSSNQDKTASEAAAEATQEATEVVEAEVVAEDSIPEGAIETAEATPEVVEAEAAPEVAEAAPETAEVEAVAVSAKSGQELYDGFCKTCHDTSLMGAPKPGDKENWAPRIAQGKDTLYQHAIEGYQGNSGMMPPKGGSSYSDDEMKSAVDYMVAQSS